jgi:hypothetical protein
VPATEDGPPTLIVEVVDPVWIPLPYSDVTVKPVKGGASKSARADENGNAKFWVDTGVEYTIEAKADNFNPKTLNHVFIAKPKASAPTAHVQVKLEPKGPFTNNK